MRKSLTFLWRHADEHGATGVLQSREPPLSQRPVPLVRPNCDVRHPFRAPNINLQSLCITKTSRRNNADFTVRALFIAANREFGVLCRILRHWRAHSR
jgi:hypothetical protein